MRRWALPVLLVLACSATPVASAFDGTPIGAPNPVSTGTSGVVEVARVDAATSNVNITWTTPSSDGGSAITGYGVSTTLNTSSGAAVSGANCSVPADTLTCVITGLNFATTYVFKVVASNAIGTSTPTSSVAFLITPKTQTVTITGNPGDRTWGQPDFQLHATASSGFGIAWSSATAGTCTIDSTGTVHPTSIGDCSVVATQDGAGTAYSSANDTATVKTLVALSATQGSASNIQGTSATLNATIPFPGVNVSPIFLLAKANVGGTCTLSSGVSSGTLSPSVIFLTSANSISASISSLLQGTQYCYWAQVTYGGNTVTSSSATFTTLTGPTLLYTGTTSGQVNVSQTGTLTATGGSGIYATWDVLAGSLPTGLTMTVGSGSATIDGTPTTAGNSDALFTVVDSNGLSTDYTVHFTIASASAPAPTPVAPTPVTPAPAPDVTPTPIPRPVAVIPNLAIALDEATNIQSKTMTLHATVVRPDADVVVKFCISETNALSSCSLPSGVSVSTPSPGVVTESTGNSVSADVSGLSPRSNYYVWAVATAGTKSVTSLIRMIHSANGPTLIVTGTTSLSIKDAVKISLVAISGSGTYKTWTTANLPAGLVFKGSGSNALISGSATKSGIFGITISVVDSTNLIGSILVTLDIEGLALDGQPAPVTSSNVQIIAPTSIRVSWAPSNGAASYEVRYLSKTLCVTTAASCVITSLLGPKAPLEVIAKSATGVAGNAAKPIYKAPAKLVQIGVVNFALGSSALSTSAQAQLKKLASTMYAQGFTSIVVAGHTDTIGGVKLNNALSLARATTTYKYLQKILTNMPISVTLQAKGYREPLASNKTAEGRAINRRAVLSLS